MRRFARGQDCYRCKHISGADGWSGKSNGVDDPALKESDIDTNGITLHVTEQGNGPAVLFCHGFPDTSYTWRRQMKAAASAGYRAIAPDMRGYGRSSAPADPTLYTPLYTAGDLVGLLDVLNLPSAVIVGHDWGATHAWNAALMRPDRFKAVFCLSVPYVPRGDVSVFERMRKSGHENDFYMFEQIKPEADQVWANAAVTIPGALYWASASASADKRWSPMDPARSLHRPAPGPLPSWAEPDYVAHNVSEFERTGFHGALNYYRAAEPYFDLSAAWKGAKITQPSFYIAGKADGLGDCSTPLSKNSAPVFPVSWGISNLMTWATGYNTRRRPRWQRAADREVPAHGQPCLKELTMAAAFTLTGTTFRSFCHATRHWRDWSGGRAINDLPPRLAPDRLGWRAQVEAFVPKAGTALRQTCAAMAPHRHRALPRPTP